jgi:drug/metabolite transporter (DMT)-like permease
MGIFLFFCKKFYMGIKFKITSHQKGYLLAIISAFSLSIGYIYSKTVLNELEIFQFGFYWFGFASLWSSLLIIKSWKKINIRAIDKRSWYAIIANTIFEVIGSILFYIAIQKMENPTIVSFLVNLGAVFVMVLGYVFLHERFRPIEYFGILITLLGVLLINYTTDTSIAGTSISGTSLIIGSSLSISFALIIAKKVIHKIQPVVLTCGRLFILFIFSGLVLIVDGSSFSVNATTIFNSAIGSLTGPFLALLISYYAIKYIDASVMSAISSTKSLFLIATTYLVFSIQITGSQFMGGIVTILGILLISRGNKIIRSFRIHILKKPDAEIG